MKKLIVVLGAVVLMFGVGDLLAGGHGHGGHGGYGGGHSGGGGTGSAPSVSAPSAPSISTPSVSAGIPTGPSGGAVGAEVYTGGVYTGGVGSPDPSERRDAVARDLRTMVQTFKTSISVPRYGACAHGIAGSASACHQNPGDTGREVSK